MRTIKVEKQKLVEILKKNRAEHHNILLEAQKNYREKAIAVLDEQLELARRGEKFVLSRFVELVVPADYTEEYDRALEMLEMSVDDVVEITQQEFKNFVQDDWDWSNAWANSAAHYTQNAKVKKYL